MLIVLVLHYLIKSGCQLQRECVGVMASSICRVVASYREIKSATTLGNFYYNLPPNLVATKVA